MPRDPYQLHRWLDKQVFLFRLRFGKDIMPRKDLHNLLLEASQKGCPVCSKVDGTWVQWDLTKVGEAGSLTSCACYCPEHAPSRRQPSVKTRINRLPKGLRLFVKYALEHPDNDLARKDLLEELARPLYQDTMQELLPEVQSILGIK